MRREGYSSCLVCVCMSVCLSEHTILAVRAIRSITKDAIVLCGNIKKVFFLKLSYSKVKSIFHSPRQGRPSLVDAYSACNVSYTLRYMFAYA